MKNKDELVTAVFDRIKERKEARTQSRRRALLVAATLAAVVAAGVFAVVAFRPEKTPGPAVPAETSEAPGGTEESRYESAASENESFGEVSKDETKDESGEETSAPTETSQTDDPEKDVSQTDDPAGVNSQTEDPGNENSQTEDPGNDPPPPPREVPDSFESHEAVLRPLLASVLARPVFPTEKTIAVRDAAAGLENCFSAMTKQFLSGSDGQNKVYSPLNIYFALAMLAETAKGDTRAQIVSLLGAESMDSLREQAQTLWENHYKDEERSRVLLGSSIWLNDDDAVQYDQAVIDLLARIYYASAFSGDPLDPEFSAQYRDWINANTFDLLKNKIDNKNLPENMRFCICATAYYKSSWRDAFSYVKSDTALVFHAPGKDVVCDKFMFSRWNSAAPDSFYAGNRFKAMSKPLECGKMYFILPDEGVSADDLLADNEALAYISGGGGRAYGSNAADPDELCICELTVPAFRVDSDLDLIDGLKNLGVTDCFDESKSDLSALLKGTTRCIDQANHGATVVINEKGVEAAAYTELSAPDSVPPEDTKVYELTLDRPFIFVISVDGSPMFVGVINDPTAE